ncbi:hypothetical protein [Propionivibrio sp.]|uniref:hypothetical protein n=1 Tax=Propionivibrio sp. TaxID=2212460 RepID=UPI00260D72D1|nr:hypothetical protein [Propionivibrio sp.]
MTGIYLLFVALIWLALVVWLSKVSTRKLSGTGWRIPVGLLMAAVLFPLPLIDEIIGGRQFEQLCKENSMIQVDRATAVGKTVYLLQIPDVEIKDTWVRVVLKPWRFVDATTGELVLSYNSLMAAGGRFIRTLGISEGGVPLIFHGSCEPRNSPASAQTFKDFEINYIEPPIKKMEN